MQLSNLSLREETFINEQRTKAQKQAQRKAEQEQKAKEGTSDAEAIPLITEEETPAITDPRMLYAIITEDIKNWQKREEAPEYYEYFEDFARKEKEEYLSSKEGYDKAGYQAFNLDLTAPSRKEKARRKANYDRASQIARKLIAFNAVAPVLCNDLMSYDEVKKVKDENGQEHDVIEKIGISRKLQHTIIPLSNDFDEMEKQIKAFKEASKEEKTKIFAEKLQLLRLFVTKIY